MSDLCKRLAKTRKEKGISQAQLAEKMGIKREMVNYYEKGTRRPKDCDIISMSKALEVSSDYLLGLSDITSLDSDDKTISNLTGLKDNAIKYLKDLKKCTGKIDILNALFDTKMIEYIVNSISDCIFRVAYQKKFSEMIDNPNINQDELKEFVNEQLLMHRTVFAEKMGNYFDKLFDMFFKTAENKPYKIPFERIKELAFFCVATAIPDNTSTKKLFPESEQIVKKVFGDSEKNGNKVEGENGNKK